MPEFTTKITKATHLPEESPRSMTVVIFRPYTHIERELRNAFKGQEDVEVILDRRNGDRRKKQQAVVRERRRENRRKPKEALVEVTISI